MNEKILIIDDEASLRTMMQLALEHSGYQVEIAEDGPSGIEKFGDGSKFDLVLLDQRMPGLHGIEVYRELRKIKPGVRTIMTTAFGTAELADRAMDMGARDFLRKPFTADTLRLAVRTALDEQSSSKTAGSESFTRSTLNGYRMELLTEIHDRHFGEVVCTYKVHQPEGEDVTVKVILPQYVMELVKAHADAENVPCQNRFWQAMTEEALANYLWQEAHIPNEGVLKVAEFTPALQRWVDGVMTVDLEKANG